MAVARTFVLLLAAAGWILGGCAAREPRPRGLRAARTVCIVERLQIEGFGGSIPMRTADGVSPVRAEAGAPPLPVEEIARGLLACAGLRVVPCSEAPCDLVFTVTARGYALTREYTPRSAQPDAAAGEPRAPRPDSASAPRVFTVPSGLAWSGTVSLGSGRVPAREERFGGGLSAPVEMALRLTSSSLSGNPLWLEYDKPSGKALCALPGSFAQRAVETIGAVFGVPFLLQVIQTQPAPLDGFAEKAMGQLPVERQDVDLLVRSVTASPDWRVRRLAAQALARPSSRRAGPALVQALQDTAGPVRLAAAESLGRIGGTGAVPALVRTMGDPLWEVRRTAAQALVSTHDRRAAKPLLAALQDPEWRVRLVAAGNLADVAGRRAVEPLIGALTDPQLGVRYHAVLGLEQLDDARAVGPLVAALDDDDASLRSRVMAALRRLTGLELTEPEAWLAWWARQQQAM
ncbi:MAG: HEAT repeat domain-containing protein [Candidatus Latescibacterota bacterium]